MSEQQNAKSIVEGMFGVFGQKSDAVKFKNDDSEGSVFFKPSPKDSPNQIFRGVVKFLPNLHNIEQPKVKTVTYWINEGPNQGFRYISPKSLSKMENCIVANEYWRLKESKDAKEKALSKNIVYGTNTYVLVQIIKDLTTPANDGKIMLWNLPQAIIKKIDSQMYPSKEDIEAGEVENNVFDPINGFTMTLKIQIKTVLDEKTGKTNEYRDYDECKFNEKAKKTIILEGEKAQVELSENPETLRAQQEGMLKTILAGPNLEDYAYKTPSETTMERVHKALKNLTGLEIPAAPVETSAPAATQATAAPVETSAPAATQATAAPVETSAPAATGELTEEQKLLIELGLDQ